MEKIVRTVYRQIYKKAYKVERDIAMRSVLTCSPQRVYDHRRGDWVSIDVAKQAGWPESRVFLDNFIRRLNSGREFFIPMEEENSAKNNNSKAPKKNTPTTTTTTTSSGSSTSSRSSSSGSSNSGGNSDSDGAIKRAESKSNTDVGSKGTGNTSMPLGLLQTLRESFESTPFTVTQLNRAFAVLKELAYVTDMAEKHSSSVVPPPELAATMPKPKLTVVSKVEEMHHLSLTKGLSDALEQVGMEEKDMGISTGDVTLEKETIEGGEESQSSSSSKTPSKTPFETPKTVQLLLAHPQLYDFFRYTVMIVVRATPNESAAFVLNKPLENEEGMLMPVSATIRLNHVHPILGKHLSNHTVMIGGPVSRGSFDSSILLLHRIPDVDDAIPLSRSLWVDGNYDVLQKKIEDGTADPNDIMVICGFSGWGVQQLPGEVNSGTWIVARGNSDDPAMDDFVFALARHAGTLPPTPKEGKTTGITSEVSSSSSSDTAGMQRTTGMLAEANRKRTAAAWAWAYSALGAPYSDLARNQKPLLQDPPEK
ncbi:uncharacterized protein TM35_000301970 [Trypanosoma theileri]|uniref:Uncharacterized protein n=1 Tax=Trypanosoma theileri TaxID=67003 RepID=A0A1X0NN76_9TRYP|nr:uncharacterized protein TM35_000301970 [Trypanosoma theileri]ORC86157.1 hypothetical protein TM35_000301970 [Trypanosoma theileri]